MKLKIFVSVLMLLSVTTGYAEDSICDREYNEASARLGKEYSDRNNAYTRQIAQEKDPKRRSQLDNERSQQQEIYNKQYKHLAARQLECRNKLREQQMHHQGNQQRNPSQHTGNDPKTANPHAVQQCKRSYNEAIELIKLEFNQRIQREQAKLADCERSAR